MTTAQSIEGLLWRRSVREGCSGYQETTSPSCPLLLTQMSWEPLVYTVKVQRASAGACVTMRGLFRKRKADSWGRRLFWTGAVIWHTQAGTEASTDGRGAERLRGDSYSTLRMAVTEQHVGGRRGRIYFRGTTAPHLASMLLRVLHTKLAHRHTDGYYVIAYTEVTHSYREHFIRTCWQLYTGKSASQANQHFLPELLRQAKLCGNEWQLLTASALSEAKSPWPAETSERGGKPGLIPEVCCDVCCQLTVA